jgi:hypothetical protein
MHTYNVVGKADGVTEVIRELHKLTPERIVSDVFLTKDPGCRDVNIKVGTGELADTLVKLCEERSLICNLV